MDRICALVIVVELAWVAGCAPRPQAASVPNSSATTRAGAAAKAGAPARRRKAVMSVLLQQRADSRSALTGLSPPTVTQQLRDVVCPETGFRDADTTADTGWDTTRDR